MQRITFLDYVRTIACFLVMLVHACEFYYTEFYPTTIIADESTRLWVSIYDGFSRMSVPLFMIVSAFLLAPMKDFGNANDNSLVLKVSYGDISALFMGDAERSVEAELIKRGEKIESDILKVGHHGSRYASSLEFLTFVRPSVCVIQSGEGNSYGHPHLEAIERIEKTGGQILRTDKMSHVVLRTDGESIYNASGEKMETAKENLPLEKVYTGNKKSRVFHCETCPNLPSEKNSINFKTRDEAVSKGYKPCGNCNP